MNIYALDETIRLRHEEDVRRGIRRQELVAALPDERPMRQHLATALRRLADRLDRPAVYTAPRA